MQSPLNADHGVTSVQNTPRKTLLARSFYMTQEKRHAMTLLNSCSEVNVAVSLLNVPNQFSIKILGITSVGHTKNNTDQKLHD